MQACQFGNERNLPIGSTAKSCAPKPEQGRERAQSKKEVLGNKRTKQRTEKELKPTNGNGLRERASSCQLNLRGPSSSCQAASQAGQGCSQEEDRRKVQERWQPLSCDSTVSWQKEAGTSEQITFQISCWSVTAGKVTDTSIRREVSTLLRPSRNRTSQENPGEAQEIQWHRHVGLNKSKATKEMCFNEVRLFRVNFPVTIFEMPCLLIQVRKNGTWKSSCGRKRGDKET